VGAPRDTNLFVGGGHRLLPHPAKNAVVRATPDGMRNAAGTCRKPRRPGDAADLIDAWQRWAPTGPDELDATLRLRIPANDARPRLEIVGTLLGTEADTTDLLADLVRRTATELSRNTGCCPIAWRSGHSRAMACSTVPRTHR
jgi:hypothetical protein